MRRVGEQVRKAATTNETVLIHGETGTGKESLARAVHEHSSRKDQPYVVVDCTGLPEGLAEVELFGHERGAFTGAEARRNGLLLMAEKGTVFFDEISELPLPIQAKLLRFLETRTARIVGNHKQIKVDARIVAATNKDLAEEVKKGRFREDLLFRLDVLTIKVPPLRERKDEIPRLAAFFLQQEGRQQLFASDALAMLRFYPWTGNVRQLKNLVTKVSVYAEEGKIIGGETLSSYLG